MSNQNSLKLVNQNNSQQNKKHQHSQNSESERKLAIAAIIQSIQRLQGFLPIADVDELDEWATDYLRALRDIPLEYFDRTLDEIIRYGMRDENGKISGFLFGRVAKGLLDRDRHETEKLHQQNGCQKCFGSGWQVFKGAVRYAKRCDCR
jgi:hypothetical protein